MRDVINAGGIRAAGIYFLQRYAITRYLALFRSAASWLYEASRRFYLQQPARDYLLVAINAGGDVMDGVDRRGHRRRHKTQLKFRSLRPCNEKCLREMSFSGDVFDYDDGHEGAKIANVG